jgi:uncharacterized protein YpmB
MNKKGGIGLLILIIVVVFVILIGAGIWAYLEYFSGPYPKISGFNIDSVDDENALSYQECSQLETGKQVCISGVGSVTYGSSGEQDDVVRMEVTLGAEDHKAFLKSLCEKPLYTCERNIIIDGKTYETQKMIYWYYEENKYFQIKQWGNNMKILESPVVKYFLKKYPPVAF